MKDTNTDFSKKLALTNRSRPIITKKSLFSIDILSEMLKKSFEVSNPLLIEPLFSKNIRLSSEESKQVQIKDSKKTTLFLVWGVVTKYSFFLLVGCDTIFFPNREFVDPLREDDDFFFFATSLKKKLGLENAIPYYSNYGFFFDTLKRETETHSFFLYQA